MSNATITIGYYPIRGKAQVCRLLCQYLEVDYIDRLFSITDWERQKKQKLKGFSLKQLPYIEQGAFRIAGSIPMCFYIIDRFSNGELLGKNIKDQALIDMYLWTIDAMSGIININCQKKTQAQMKEFKQTQWRNVVAPRLQIYEERAQIGKWFIGYLTIIDFSIYELINYMEMIFGQKVNELKKLKQICVKFGELDIIKRYQHSQRAIKQKCPTTLLRQMKEQIIQEEENKR